ncbi:hypothetical protein FXO38_22942 [Capsicum annuum]|nr:hypothetical protein FXO38_22942 [Capsicum annuum]
MSRAVLFMHQKNLPFSNSTSYELLNHEQPSTNPLGCSNSTSPCRSTCPSTQLASNMDREGATGLCSSISDGSKQRGDANNSPKSKLSSSTDFGGHENIHLMLYKPNVAY